MAIRLFLISDYHLIALGLEALLQADPGRFQLLVTAFEPNSSTLEAIVAATPDVLLLDIDTNPDESLRLISELQVFVPSTKILILTHLYDRVVQDRAVMSGASGVIEKKSTPDVVLTAIAKIVEGQLWLDHETTRRIFSRFSRASKTNKDSTNASKVSKLTERERHIVRFYTLNSSDSGKVLASKLNISEKTLRNHLTSIYGKLGITSSHALLGLALQNGLNTLLDEHN